ncbi:MAG: LamG domain-containing protein [Verrucomicrobia bacterium]|nr:LamG domain-containing protein [Verrucomicrobiota bacterium]
MNRMGSAACLVAVAHVAACVTVSTPSATQLMRVRLDDGSVLSLVPRAPALQLRTDIASVSIPWEAVEEARQDRALWAVKLRNGDRVRGVPDEASFAGAGTLDRVQIPYGSIQSLAPCAPAPAVTSAPPVGSAQARIAMRDGSSVRGAVRLTGLRLSSRLLGTIEFAPEELLRVDLSRDPAEVVLRNGDRIVGTVAGGALSAKTDTGDLKIPLERIDRIGFEGDRGAAGLPEGLVAYYPMDAPDPDIRDASGNGNEGRAHGARFADAGAIGGCFEFRGDPEAGDFIRVPHSLSLVSMQETRQLTLCAWIRARSLPDTYPMIVCKGGNHPPDCSGGYDFCLNAAINHDMHSTSDTMALWTTDSRGELIHRRMNEWVHVAVAIWSRSDGIDFSFYVDGVRSRFKGMDPFCNGRNARFEVINDLYIGGPDPRHHPNRAFFDGWIDEVMIFNRKLSEEEIRGIYERRTGGGERTGDRPPPNPDPDTRPSRNPGSPSILRRG